VKPAVTWSFESELGSLAASLSVFELEYADGFEEFWHWACWVEGGPLCREIEFTRADWRCKRKAIWRIWRSSWEDDVAKTLSGRAKKRRKGAEIRRSGRTKKRYLASRWTMRTSVWMKLAYWRRCRLVECWMRKSERDDSKWRAIHQTEWGMRIISNSGEIRRRRVSLRFGVALFTGWLAWESIAITGAAAYDNCARMRVGAGWVAWHVTEVLSGDYYQPLSTASPHQIWSAAMVISPVLRGMLGLQVDATTHTVVMSPHVPADWNHFSLTDVRVAALHFS